MTLKLTGRNPARFEFDDGVSQTTVTIQPDDDADSVRAKLQRVLELEEPHTRARIQATGLVAPNALRTPEEPVFTPADRAATEERMSSVQTMGWTGDADFDSLPER